MMDAQWAMILFCVYVGVFSCGHKEEGFTLSQLISKLWSKNVVEKLLTPTSLTITNHRGQF